MKPLIPAHTLQDALDTTGRTVYRSLIGNTITVPSMGAFMLECLNRGCQCD
jgi:hypothetical protein